MSSFRLLVIAGALLSSGCPAHRAPPLAEDPSLRPALSRLAQNPDDVEARLELAAARRRAGDLEGALVEVYKALASDPRSAAAHVERARIYFERGLVEKEIEAWRAVLELDPQRPGARENLGHALVAAGRQLEAAAEYRRVLSEQPDALPVLFNLALLETDAGNVEEARRLWTEYLERDPSGPWSDRARTALEKLAKKAGR